MGVFVGAVSTVFVVLLFAAAAALFRPYGPFKTRLRAGAGLVLALFVIGGLASVTPDRPADVSPAEWTRRLGVCREAGEQPSCALKATDVAEAQAKLHPPLKQAATAQSTTGDPVLDLTADGKTLVSNRVRKLDRLGLPCDRAVQTASRLHDRYSSYRAAKRAQQACYEAGIAMDRVKFGDPLSPAAQSDLNEAVNCFSLAYVGRSNAMGDAAKILDGDDRPSKVADFREEMSEALDKGHTCGVQLAAAGAKHGLTRVMEMASKASRRAG